jgi:putative (di)nucleoside polyphosphate hydrolase
MQKPYFRPGAGSVIYNESGEILLFERTDLPGVWQFQQGGMETDESPTETLWRELHEETGLVEQNFLTLTEFPNWTTYTYPPDVRAKFDAACLGQVHRWFFLKIQPETIIDLTKAADQEFMNWRWSTFDSLLLELLETGGMKRDVYTTLARFFNEHIVPTKN